MTGNFNISGSDTPRAFLAYYYSVLHTINEYTTSTFCPIIVDSPKQQDQDSQNWHTIMTFIKNNTPSNWQLILGSVDTSDVNFEGTIIDLTDKYHLLKEGDIYDKLVVQIKPLLNKAWE